MSRFDMELAPNPSVSAEGIAFVSQALEHHCVNPEDVIIVGGAVMQIYGLRTAQDVDALALPSLFVAREADTPPGGIAFLPHASDRDVLTTPARLQVTHLDLLRPSIGGISLKDKDGVFRMGQRSAQVLQTDGLYHIGLQGVLAHKETIRPKRSKDRDDIRLIRDVLSRRAA